MNRVLNLELLRNPWNWVAVVTMVLLASICVRYIATAAANAANEE